MNDLDLCLAVV